MKNISIPISILIATAIISGAILYNGKGRVNQGIIAQKAQTNLLAGTQSNTEIKVTDTDPSLGSQKAPVTIIAFEDFECPFCRRFSQQTEPLLIQNEIKNGAARLVWKDFPLSIHSHAQKAHEAARCAWEQGKFWEYHDLLFNNQNDLKVNSLKQYAKELGLNENQFTTCLDSGKYASLIKEKVNEGIAAGVNGTPSFLINGAIVVGAQPYQTFVDAIARAKLNSQ